MRQYVYGFILGALAVYWYVFYGHQVSYAKHTFDSWRDDAVKQTGGYSAGRQPK
jgi:hypothetical protein